MRILLVWAILGSTAACAWEPPAVPPPPPIAPPAGASAVTAPGPVALVPPPAPAVPAPPSAAAPAPPAPAVAAARPASAVPYSEVAPVPLLWLRGLTAPPPAGRLLLNNFSFEPARVQAVLTSGPDCAPADSAAVADFVLLPNGTRILPAPPGTDICWRREVTAAPSKETPAGPSWTRWNRAFTAPGRFLDATLGPDSGRAEPLYTVIPTAAPTVAPTSSGAERREK